MTEWNVQMSFFYFLFLRSSPRMGHNLCSYKKDCKGCGLTSEPMSGRKVVLKLCAGIEGGSVVRKVPSFTSSSVSPFGRHSGQGRLIQQWLGAGSGLQLLTQGKRKRESELLLLPNPSDTSRRSDILVVLLLQQNTHCLPFPVSSYVPSGMVISQ